MLRRSSCLALSFIFMLVFYSIPHVHAETDVFHANVELNTFISTRIVLSFAYTNTITVSDVQSLGQSVYKTVSSPYSVEFITDAIDTFTFTVTILYDEVVSQNITLAIFSGDYPPQGYTWEVKSKKLIINFKVTTMTQPKYPTPEEIAQKSVEVLRNEMSRYTWEVTRTTNVMRENMSTMWVIVVFAGASAFLYVGSLIFGWGRRRREE